MTDHRTTEKAYWTNEVAEMVGVSDSTIRKWCIELEKNGYQFMKGANDSRAYTEQDIFAIRKFQTLLKENKLTKESAAVLITEQFKQKENEGTPPVQVDNGVSPIRLLVAQIKSVEDRFAEMAETIEQQDRLLKVLSQQKDPIEERQQRITDMITQRRIESELKAEAEQIWNDKPEAERMKKIGWFKKDVDRDKRERFVRDYIDQNYAERLRKEYEV